MSRDNLGSSLVFFMLGAATGAAIALLYAPQEGEATRRHDVIRNAGDCQGMDQRMKKGAGKKPAPRGGIVEQSM